VTMANRYLEGYRPVPSTDGALGRAWAEGLIHYRRSLDASLLHDALAAMWDYVGVANQFVDSQKPWELAKAAKAGDDGAEDRLRAVLGDLLEACRLVALAAAAFMPNTAPRVLAQLGYRYRYEADGNGGPPLLDELRWGAHRGESGRLTAAEPLFPRLDVDSAESGSSSS
jgi:methionyl-tRNA synthetase